MRWSSDSEHVLFKARADKACLDLYRIDVDTGKVVCVLEGNGGKDAQTTWSSDGKIFFKWQYDRGNKMCSIIRLDMETGEEKEIFRNEAQAPPSFLTLSPKEDLLAFHTSHIENEKQINRLMILPAEGGEPCVLLAAKYPEERFYSIGWTHDGENILLTKINESLPEVKYSLWRVPVEGSVSKSVEIDIDIDLDLIRSVSVHPDGRQVAFTASKGGDSEVWVMENFLPLIKKRQK